MLKFKSQCVSEPLDAFLVEDAYANNGRVYLGLWCNEDGYFEPWADITVNLSGPVTDLSCGFVDTANCPEIVRFLEENGLAAPTGRTRMSGWNVYPEYRFDMEAVRKHNGRDMA